MLKADKKKLAEVIARCIMSIPKETAIELLSAKVISIQSKSYHHGKR